MANDWILVKDDELKETKDSKIVLPENREDQMTETGIIIKAGPGIWDKREGVFLKVEFKEDQHIMYHQRSGLIDIKLNDQKYRIIKDQDVMAVLGT